jgi:cobalamin biosynthesis protein CbiD
MDINERLAQLERLASMADAEIRKVAEDTYDETAGGMFDSLVAMADVLNKRGE